MAPRSSVTLWYAWAALFGVVAALIAAAVAIAWIALGIDDWLASHGLPAWFGHGVVTVATIAAIGIWVQRVRSPH
jgi:hypothetical protein